MDDSACSIVDRDPAKLSSILSKKYRVIEDYIKNKLVINADKIHLVVMGSREVTMARQAVSMQSSQRDCTEILCTCICSGISLFP